MNKSIYILASLFLYVFFFASCGEEKDDSPVTIGGEWNIVERILSTNDASLDKNVNELFLEDSRNYKVRRIFDINQGDPSIGAIQTIAINRQSNVLQRKRIGTYSIAIDSLFIQDELISDFRQKYLLRRTLLETEVKVTKKELDVLIYEIGGDPNTVREGTVGILKMREVK